MNEETTDRVVRALIATIPILVILLAFLLTFAFPRGIRIPLGRRALWLAPPAVPIYSYFRMAAQYRQNNVRRAAALEKLRTIHADLDKMLVYLVAEIPELAATGRIEVSHDPVNRIVVALFLGVEADTRLHFEAFQEHAGRVDELLAQPVARSLPELLSQDDDLFTNLQLALMATQLRNSSFGAVVHTVKRVLRPLTEIALQPLDAQRATLDQISGVLQSLGDQVDELDDQIAQVEQPNRKLPGPGRPAKREWSDDKIRGLNAAYLVRGEQTSVQFAKRNHLTESQMFKLFRRVGITKKAPGNYDSEF